MKKFLKRMVSFFLVGVIVLGAMPLHGLSEMEIPKSEKLEKAFVAIQEFFEGFTPKAEAATMSEDAYKIVIKWGSAPKDLDSHVSGTLSDGTSFHCYYANKNIFDDGNLVVNLDTDDTSGYGPETITIDPSVFNGDFTYYIYNFSGTGSIPASGASVSLYKGDVLIDSYNVSGSSSGRYWSLFHVENGKIYLINEIGSSVSTNHTENLGDSIEDVMYRNGIPVLSSTDAKDFLCFLYNKELTDVTSDPHYKLLTGSLSGYSSDDVKNMIAAFGAIVQPKLNSYVESSTYQSEIWRNALIERLEKELPSKMKVIGDAIVDNAKSFSSGEIFKSLEVVVDNDSLELAGKSIGEILEAADAIGKVKDFYTYSFVAMESFLLAYEQEKVGRYSYFNSYLINRGTLSDEAFVTLMDYNFFAIADSTYMSNLINLGTWITGKDSWTNHREELDRWAEYLYQLCEYQKKDTHSYSVTVHSPSCDFEGYTEYVCLYCGEVYYDSYKDALGHKYTKTTVKPSCEADGYDLYSCVRCSGSYKDNTVSATGHKSSSRKTVAATCLSGGYDLVTCSCGASWKENEVEVLEHSYESTVVEPTETEQGYTYHKCSLCKSEYYSDYIDPTGHTFTTVETEPTCESEGYTTHTCSGCGYEYVDSTVSALEHSYEIIEQIDATCVSEGSISYECKNCGVSYSETLDVKEHDYTYSATVIEENCDEQGYTIYNCECGETLIDDYVDATGHDYAITEQSTVTCTEDGFTVYKCSICDDAYTETEYSQGHQFEFVETVEAACLTSGYTLKVCSTCGCEHYSDVIPPKDHTLGEWEALRDENGNLTGQREVNCLYCDFVLTEENPSHSVSFIVDGEIYNSYECAYDDMLTIPDDPIKEGYTFVSWTPAIPESMPDMDMEFTAVFEAITYTATFMEGETVVGTDEFTVEDTELDLSVVEYREGYEYVYDDYEIAANDIVINGRYDVITYTATFVIDGETVSAQQFTVEDMTIEEPEISHKDGYTYAWEEYEVQLADFTVNAIYTPIVYTATFMDGETVVGTDEFTVEDTILDYPETTVKEHYDWVWDDYEIIADNITVAGGYVPVAYTASFVADGVVVDEVEFNIENQSVVAPEIPEKAGYTAAWETYEINLADFVVNAIYTPIVYIATFTHNGEVIGTDDFTVEDVSLNYPTMETKEYYDWIWDEHEIIADDITVNGEYVPITYTIKFVSNGKTVKTQSFTVETVDTVTQPSFSLPSKAGYYSDWEEWEGKICNLTVNEVYVPIKYTASFYCDNKLIISRTFTVETKIEQLPAPKAPTRAGYYAVWDEYSIVARDMEIHARYVPIKYSAQFVVDGVIISTQKFTVETESLDEPDIPQKAGYIARWSSYKIEARDLTIIAKYHLPEVVTVSKRTLDVGETFRLLPSCNFEITEKSWSSNDNSVATVNQHGKVTAVGKGECEITVTCYGKDSLGNDIQASKVTKIIVNDKSEPQNFKQSFREKFNEFFEVTLYDLLYNLREFMIVLFKYVWQYRQILQKYFWIEQNCYSGFQSDILTIKSSSGTDELF